MSNGSTSLDSPRLQTVGLWALRIALALAFGAAGLAKLFGTAVPVNEFARIGLGQWFRYFTAVTELTGVALVLLPRTTFLGTLILLAVCTGAFVVEIALRGEVIHVLALGALVGLTLWTTRPAVWRKIVSSRRV
jgi:uncharacterized membrane protein YphA (DoxX/SURF4 family)